MGLETLSLTNGEGGMRVVHGKLSADSRVVPRSATMPISGSITLKFGRRRAEGPVARNG